MSNILVNNTAGMSIVSTLGIDYGIATNLTTAVFPLYTPFASGTVATNMTASGTVTGNGVINGAPTISNSNFVINTAGIDYVVCSNIQDKLIGNTAPDFTAFVVVLSTDATPDYIALSTLGTDPGNPYSTGTHGVNLTALNATTLRFQDYEWTGSVAQTISTNATVTNFSSQFKCICFQRGTSGGTTTRNLYDLTGAVSGTTTSTNMPLNNLTTNFQIGKAPGGAAGKADIPLVILIQSVNGGGAFLSTAAIQQYYLRIKATMAALPTPITV